MQRARLLRVIEYDGPIEWVIEEVKKRGVKGLVEIKFPSGEICIIREAIIGEVPTILTTGQGETSEA